MRWIYLTIGLFVFSCTGTEKDVQTQDEYFHLFEPVKKSLESSKSGVSSESKKIILYKNNKSIVELDTSSINDIKRAFQQLHINKKAYRGVYKCDTLQEDNEVILRYSLKPGEKSDIKSLDLYFDGKIEYEQLDSFKVIRRNSNFLYTNEEELQIELEKGKIRRALLSGTQDLILLKNKEYRLEIII